MPKTRTHKYNGKTFTLHEGEGCYIRITHRRQTGYAGVNLRGTKDRPYAWHTDKGSVTADGLQGGGGASSMDDVIRVCCNSLAHTADEIEQRREFNPEEACKAMHEWWEKL